MTKVVTIFGSRRVAKDGHIHGIPQPVVNLISPPRQRPPKKRTKLLPPRQKNSDFKQPGTHAMPSISRRKRPRPKIAQLMPYTPHPTPIKAKGCKCRRSAIHKATAIIKLAITEAPSNGVRAPARTSGG